MSNAFWNNPIVHGIVSAGLFLLPLIISSGGSWQAFTLGGILSGLYQILKNKSTGLTVMGVTR